MIPVTVFLDGSAAKQIREEKNLTQLYVSKVVGVTTDTISRWENNRYPTIKRDNALKLAEALEVEVEEILFTDNASCDLVSADEKRKNLSLILILLGLAVLALVVGRN